MNELVQQIAGKIGVSEEQAQESVTMVISFLKDKLPENMHGILDGVAGGEEGQSSGVADMAKNALGGMFGKKD